ncbi:hypothetical protein [Streptomyces sp. R33]|uniref:Uncharacterized protein n=1 Tax=Streptomyces sp. R33 TaxID=3238629 RepID=A0AB39YF54_9ACTN
MICIYGQAGRGRSLAVNTSLRELAPRLTRPIQFRYLRYLWDDIGLDLTIVFTGGDGCFEMLQSEPMLEARAYAWQEIEPMPLEEVLHRHPGLSPPLGRRRPGPDRHVR